MEITLESVARCMSAHVPMYAWRRPVYQHVMLQSLQQLWEPDIQSALDVGGGTGLMAQTVKTLFGLRRVASVDIQDRYLGSLSIETAIYDGCTLPFPDGSFDCILLFNVLHHVPRPVRPQLLRECRRVAGIGPIFIKDHLAQGVIDDIRLGVLDLLGNVPFNGMIRASYLRADDWQDLAKATGLMAGEPVVGKYRTGAFAALFPNRLETAVKWRPSDARA